MPPATLRCRAGRSSSCTSTILGGFGLGFRVYLALLHEAWVATACTACHGPWHQDSINTSLQLMPSRVIQSERCGIGYEVVVVVVAVVVAVVVVVVGGRGSGSSSSSSSSGSGSSRVVLIVIVTI